MMHLSITIKTSLILFIISACASQQRHVAIVQAPRCHEPEYDDLSESLEHQEKVFNDALNDTALSVVVRDRLSAISVVHKIKAPRLIIYSGHGTLLENAGTGHVNLCLENKNDNISPRDLLSTNSSDGLRTVEGIGNTDSSPAILILNTCYSAYVDLSKIGEDIAVISASYGKISPHSGFAKAVAASLKNSKLDKNCDGIVTDEELFNRIVIELRRIEFQDEIVPFVELRAQPLLRRHARGQVPLYIPSTCKSIMMAPRISNLNSNSKLARALRTQENYAQGKSMDFPTLDWDYYVLVKRADVSTKEVDKIVIELQGKHRDRMLKPFPGSMDEAIAVARYAVFTEVYALEIYPPYLRIVRLRDNSLVATRKNDARDVNGSESYIESFPFRDQRLIEKDNKTFYTLRILRDSAYLGDEDHGVWLAIPCERTLVGECFKKVDSVADGINGLTNSSSHKMQIPESPGRNNK